MSAGIESNSFRQTSDAKASSFAKESHVAVLIATYNPNKKFLTEQIDSIRKQKNVQTSIYWSDDSSDESYLKDATEIFERIPHKHVPLGKHRKGVNANFLNLLQSASDPTIDFFAFSDQDDVWDHLKLFNHASVLIGNEHLISGTHSKAQTFGDNIESIQIDRCQSHDIKTLLAENCVQGCTLVINRKARELILSVDPEGLCWYDWWIGCLIAITGKLELIGGVDTHYRLHGNNLIGFPSTLSRIRNFSKKTFGVSLSQAKNLHSFAETNNLVDSKSEILKWISGHQGGFWIRVRFSIFDGKRRKRHIDDFIRRCISIARLH
jgi:hypothetical protein